MYLLGAPVCNDNAIAFVDGDSGGRAEVGGSRARDGQLLRANHVSLPGRVAQCRRFGSRKIKRTHEAALLGENLQHSERRKCDEHRTVYILNNGGALNGHCSNCKSQLYKNPTITVLAIKF